MLVYGKKLVFSQNVFNTHGFVYTCLYKQQQHKQHKQYLFRKAGFKREITRLIQIQIYVSSLSYIVDIFFNLLGALTGAYGGVFWQRRPTMTIQDSDMVHWPARELHFMILNFNVFRLIEYWLRWMWLMNLDQKIFIAHTKLQINTYIANNST